MDFDAQRLVDQLGVTESVDVARRLLNAEAARLGLSLDGPRVTTRVFNSDQGVDGISDFPTDADSLYPKGPCVWQIKSGKTAPSVAKEFKATNRRLIEAIERGEGYVMFWAHDGADAELIPVREEFREKVHQLSGGKSSFEFCTASSIARLLRANLGVLQTLYPILGGCIAFESWGRGFQSPPIKFVPDKFREKLIGEIRAHVASSAPPAHLHVVGDTGVGKSRTVFEALNRTGDADRVVVVLDASEFKYDLLTQMVSEPEHHLVLVVDDCDDADSEKLAKYASYCEGRVRLVTIGPPPSRSKTFIEPTNLLLPLKEASAKQIALEVGLSPSEAELVATFTEGYPGFTRLVADGVKSSGPIRSMVELIGAVPKVQRNLEALFPDPAIQEALGLLSLFDRMGFDDEFEAEQMAACRAFGVDATVFREIVERETGRHVSKAGRYRQVTPKLSAAWLAGSFLRSRRSTFVANSNGLLPSLQEQMLNQFRTLAGDPILEAITEELLAQLPFRSGAIADVDAGTARFIHVAAAIAPEKALESIERLLKVATDEEIESNVAARRDLVWALENLSWLGEYFDRVATLLLRLALNENETWANNATAVLQGLFQVRLGGTTAPYLNRLTWAEGVLAVESEDVDRVLIPAIGKAFDFFESRTVLNAGVMIEPSDWSPGSAEEDLAVRFASWALLVKLARESTNRADLIAPVMAGALIRLSRFGLLDNVLDDVSAIDWSVEARRHFIEDVTTLIRLEGLADVTLTRLATMLESWEGGDFWERLDVIASMSRWKLLEERGSTAMMPRVLTELAHELANRPVEDSVETARRTRDGDPETVGLIFEALAKETGDLNLLSSLALVVPLPVSAVLGAFGGLRESLSDDDIDALLESWIGGPLQDLIIRSMMFVSATDRRAEICADAVASGTPARSLSNLYYGNWCSSLGQDALSTVLRLLIDSGDKLEVNHGLGILGGWLDKHQGESIDRGLKEIGHRLLDIAPNFSSGDPMVPFHFAKVVGRLDLSYESQVALVIKMLAGAGVHPGSETFDELDRLARVAPNVVLDQLLEVITATDPDVRLQGRWLEGHGLISRLAGIVGGDFLLDKIRNRMSPEQIGDIAEYISFSDALPADWLVDLFNDSPGDVLGQKSIYHFIYPTGGWMGPQSNMFRASRSRAQSWLDKVGPSSKMGVWLVAIIESLDEQIARAERYEAERGW